MHPPSARPSSRHTPLPCRIRPSYRWPTLVIALLVVGLVSSFGVPAPGSDPMGGVGPAVAMAQSSKDGVLRPESLPARVRTQLINGEAVVELRPRSDERRGSEGTALLLIATPLDRVLRAVRDFAHYRQFMPFMVRSNSRQGKDGKTVTAVELDLPFPQTDRNYSIRKTVDRAVGPREAGRRVAWEMVPGSGNVRAHEGSFTLVPWPGGGTLVEVRLMNDVGGAIPRSWQDEALEESLPWVLDGLAQHARRCRYERPVPRGCKE